MLQQHVQSFGGRFCSTLRLALVVQHQGVRPGPDGQTMRTRAAAARQQPSSSVPDKVVEDQPQLARKRSKVTVNSEVVAVAVSETTESTRSTSITHHNIRDQPPATKAKRSPRKVLERPASADSLAKAALIAEQLMELYEDPGIPLDYSTDFQLLVAVVLSAQTTDKKVNQVTKELFALAPDAARMAVLQVSQIEDILRPLGLAATKAKNLARLSKQLLERHDRQVPRSFEKLEALAGVGHKTASVVLAIAWGVPTFPVDTHIHRLAQRWGLSCGSSVEQTEADLKLLFPKHTWNRIHLRLIYFGREHCPAKRHDAAGCLICRWAAAAQS